jgi:hypothetical protein
MKQFTFGLICVIMLLIGCGKVPDQKALVLEPESGPTLYQVQTKPVDDDKVTTVPGKDVDSIITVVTIPASTVPTTITIIKEKKTVRQVLFPKKKEQEHKVSVVSTNQEVKAVFIEQTPWWEYVLWIIGILTPLIIILEKFFAPFKFIFSFLRRK